MYIYICIYNAQYTYYAISKQKPKLQHSENRHFSMIFRKCKFSFPNIVGQYNEEEINPSYHNELVDLHTNNSIYPYIISFFPTFDSLCSPFQSNHQQQITLQILIEN